MELEALEKATLLSLEQFGLVPGAASALVPHIFKPTTELKVAFNGKDVALGNFFRENECKSAPRISFKPEVDAAANASYLIMLVDPDAPTPENPKVGFWRHWIQSGLQPSSSDGHPITTTKPALTEYLGPKPPDYSKPHRYLFLLFREPDGFSVEKEEIGGEEFAHRQSFAALKFIQTHKLYLVGLNWMFAASEGWKE